MISIGPLRKWPRWRGALLTSHRAVLHHNLFCHTPHSGCLNCDKKLICGEYERLCERETGAPGAKTARIVGHVAQVVTVSWFATTPAVTKKLSAWQLRDSWCQCWMTKVLEDASLTELWPPFLSPWSPAQLSDGPNAIVIKVKHLSPGCSTESVLAVCAILMGNRTWSTFNSDQAKHLLYIYIYSSASVVSRCSYTKSVYWKSPPLWPTAV